MKLGLIISLVIVNCAFAQQWHLAPETAGDWITAISVYRSDPDTVYALGKAGLWLSTDGGTKWDTILVNGESPISSPYGALKVDPYNSKILYAYIPLVQFAPLLMSTDGGLVWKTLFESGGPSGSSALLEVDPSDHDMLYASIGLSGIVRTTDMGQTWDTIPEPPGGYTGELTSIAIPAVKDSVIYAGFTIGIFKSTDKGNTWQSLNIGFKVISQTLVAVDPRSADTVYAAVYPSTYTPGYLGGVYKSIDGGQTWNESDSGLTDQDRQINAIAINPKNPDQLFIGLNKYGPGGSGCLESTDGGDRWTDFSTGLPDSCAVECMAIDTANDKVLAGLSGYGLYSTDIVTGVEAPPVKTPEEYHLLQNYPNPFNPTTIITYEVPEFSHVSIVVYDDLGRRVENLVDQWKQPGNYSVRFDGSGLSSGVYFYRVTSGNYSETRKMILLK